MKYAIAPKTTTKAKASHHHGNAGDDTVKEADELDALA